MPDSPPTAVRAPVRVAAPPSGLVLTALLRVRGWLWRGVELGSGGTPDPVIDAVLAHPPVARLAPRSLLALAVAAPCPHCPGSADVLRAGLRATVVYDIEAPSEGLRWVGRASALECSPVRLPDAHEPHDHAHGVRWFVLDRHTVTASPRPTP